VSGRGRKVSDNAVVFPGALTPSEIIAAWKSGADFVKVFPCSVLGGAGYIRALKSPFRGIPLIASGGVNQQTAKVALGIWARSDPCGCHRAPGAGLDSRAFVAIFEDGQRRGLRIIKTTC
jgi:2-dehydro-3-deoxyphosphogluconate aldolase/(4S)-4-hydroxy-2-oxoglutarate aldolase